MKSFRFVCLVRIVSACAHHDQATDSFTMALATIDTPWHVVAPSNVQEIPLKLRDVEARRAADEHLRQLDAGGAEREILWRRSRLALADGLMHSDVQSARRSWSEARAYAAKCSVADDVDLLGLLRHGAQVKTSSQYALCRAWLVLSWKYWLSTMPKKARTLDVPAIDQLLETLKGPQSEPRVADVLAAATRVD